MKRLLATILLGLGLSMPLVSSAQEPLPATLEPVREAAGEADLTIIPKITAKSEIEVGKKLILSASDTDIPKDVFPTYTWTLSNGITESGEEIVVIFDQPGNNTITLTVEADGTSFQSDATVLAYEQVVTFFYNGSNELFERNKEDLFALSESQGIFLNVIGTSNTNSVISEEAFTQVLLNNQDALSNSTVLIGGPDATAFLGAIAKLSSITDSEKNPILDLTKKQVLASSKEPLWLQTKVAERLRGTLAPEEVYIIEKDPFSTVTFFLQGKSTKSFLEKVDRNDVGFVDTTKEVQEGLLVISGLLSQGITNGIPSEVMVFILFLPFLLAIIAFLKQVVGVETLGVFQTIVLTLSFLILGITLGTLTFFVALLVGATARLILRKANILHVAKVALMLSFSSIGILFLIIYGSELGILFGLDTSGGDKALLSVFPMLLIAIQADRLSLIAVRQRDTKDDLIRLLSTYIAVAIGYVLLNIAILELIILAIPELVIIAFIIQYIIGRYAGLRVMEFFRFRELIRHDIEE